MRVCRRLWRGVWGASPHRGPSASALLVTLGAACSGAPVPPPPPIRATDPPPAVPVPMPSPARWVESGGATLVGPVVPGAGGGTLVLLGGRRAVVHPDGSLETEKSAVPEPLEEIVEVPSRTASGGAGGTRLVARGAHGIYRFDDPLGAPVVVSRSEERIVQIGAGPGMIAVWTGAAGLPRFVDVDSGREQTLPGLPVPPLRSLAFVDLRRGAGVFEAVGLAVTADGGATWKLVGESGPADPLRVDGLRIRAGAVRAFAYADGPDGPVDLEAARLGTLEPLRVPAGEARMLRWIRATGRDPLEAVASGGLDLPGGGALVASHGLVARVDPRSGAVEEIVDVGKTKWVSPCGAGRAGHTAWIACALSDEAGRDLFDPFGVVRIPLDGPFAAERPALVRNGEAELRVSPSGGAMLLAPCTSEESGAACVRQPDGRWKTIAIEGDVSERGAGPLADGRLAFLRGISDGDAPPSADPAAGSKGSGAPDEATTRRLHVAIVGPDGKEHALGPISFLPSRGYVRAQSPIEEDADRTLRFVIEDGEGPFSVTVPSGREGAEVRRVSDAVVARLRAGRGIALAEGRVLASLDGGSTWNPVPTPPAALEAAAAAASTYEDPGQLVVSEMGAKVGTMLRLGWALADTPGETADGGAGGPPSLGASLSVLAPRAPVPAAPDRLLTCASQGPSSGAPPLTGSSQIRPLFLPRPATAPGTRHELATWSPGRAGMLDTVAMLDEEGPLAKGSGPARWTFHWHDPQEIGGRPRSASMPAPRDATWLTNLRFAAANGGRALFVVRTGGKVRLVRLKPVGGAEIAEIGPDLVPTGDVVFGEGRSEAIAWARDATVMVWLPGERPRAVARLATHATRTLGAPTASGVPLLLGTSDWLVTRTLPIPPFNKNTAEGPPQRPTLDGWTRVAPLPRHLEALPPCAGKAATAGALFSRAATSLHADVDGLHESAGQVVYEARLDGANACLLALTSTLSPDRRAGRAPAPGKGKAPPRGKVPDAAAFVRVDFAGKRAEGGERGIPPVAVRRMSCSLGAKP